MKWKTKFFFFLQMKVMRSERQNEGEEEKEVAPEWIEIEVLRIVAYRLG